MATKKGILTALGRMRDYYGKEPRKVIIDAYVRVLENRPEITDQEVERVVDAWIEREDWFPDRVSKFMRLLESGVGEEPMSPEELYWAGMAALNNALAGRPHDQKLVRWAERSVPCVTQNT